MIPLQRQLEKENAALRAELVVMQGEFLVERRLTRRLQEALLDRIDLLFAHPAVLPGVEIIPEASCSSASFVEATGDSASPTPSVLVPLSLAQPVMPRPVQPPLVSPQLTSTPQAPVLKALPPPVLPQPFLPQPVLPQPVLAPQAPAPLFLEPPVSADPEIEVQEQVPAAPPAQEEPVVLPGNAAEVQPFLEPGDMEVLMDAGTDSIFVRDISRALWPDDLRNRSLTGTPCRRLLKRGAMGKRALTPQKLKYVRRALAAYIERNPSPVVSAALRLGQLNTHLRRLLGDENRKRH
uniref:Putative signal recognition particle protein n=1 Tax=Ixodes ricinus TaxID=34613 RepID=A0A6B0V6F2_IXORI